MAEASDDEGAAPRGGAGDGAELRVVEVDSPDESATWDRFVLEHPAATIAHLYPWRRVIERAYGRRCRYLAAIRDGAFDGVLPTVRFPTGLVSMPYLDQGGVLARSSSSARALLHGALEQLPPGRARLQLRSELEASDGRPADEPSTRRFRLLLALPPTADELWTTLGAKVRNQIRKSQKRGLTSRQEPAALDDFYGVFARNMRDLGSPVHSRRFFAAILEAFRDTATIYVTRDDDGSAVAAGLALRFRETKTVPWASSLRRARSDCPNHSLYWQILVDAISEGVTEFDFGRSTEGTGTFRFKRQWGAVPDPLPWSTCDRDGRPLPDGTLDPRRHRFLVTAWQRLPLPVANVLGPRIRGRLAN